MWGDVGRCGEVWGGHTDVPVSQEIASEMWAPHAHDALFALEPFAALAEAAVLPAAQLRPPPRTDLSAGRWPTRLEDLSRTDLLAIAAKGCATSATAAASADRRLAEVKPLPEWAVTGVMLSDDLLPKILALLPARKSQPLVCHAWSRLRRLVLPSQLEREQSAAVLCSALRAYYLQREIADACCRALFGVGATTEGANSIRSQLLADAGAPQMVVTMIRDHGDCVPVQAASYGALGWLCAGQSGPDEEGRLRRDTIMGAGALPLIIAGMRAHPSHAAVQQTGCHALSALARGQVQAIVEAMAAAGALAAVVTGMQEHRDRTGVQENGCIALGTICCERHMGGNVFGVDESVSQAAASAGALAAMVNSLRAMQGGATLDRCSSALRLFVGWGEGSAARRASALQLGAEPAWLKSRQDEQIEEID